MMQPVAFPMKLTDWANEPSVETLRADLEAAKSVQAQQATRIRQWRDLLEVSGSAKPPKVKGRSSVQPRLVRKQAEWRYAALSEPFLSSNKLFHVRPVSFEDADAAKQNEVVLNWQFRTKLNRTRFVDQFVRACVDDGTAIVRLGWLRQQEQVMQAQPVWQYAPVQSPEQLQVLQQAAQFKQENPRAFEEQAAPELKQAVQVLQESGQAVFAVQSGVQQVQTTRLLQNQPTVQVVNPENVYIDPSCDGDFDQALFVIFSFETNKAELLKEPHRYHNLDAVNWNSGTAADAHHSYSFNDARSIAGEARRKVVAYEYWGFWDIEDNGKLEPVVVTWIGSTIVRMEANPFPDGKPPFVVVPYLPIKRSVYGEADAAMLEDNQRIMGAVSRGMIDLLGRSANAQHGFPAGMLDALNRRRFDDGLDYEFKPEAAQFSQGIIEHRYPEIPASALNMLELQAREAESLTGIKAFHGGLSGDAWGKLATGVRGMIDAAGKREMGILRRLAQGMQEIGSKVLAMNAEFMSEQETVRVTNGEFVQVSREALRGNFDLEVDIATAEIDEARAQDLAFMLQTIGPSMDAGIRNRILADIAGMKRLPELAHAIANWQPPPDDAQQQKAMLEVQRTQKEIERLDAAIALDAARAQLAQAQAQAAAAALQIAAPQIMPVPPAPVDAAIDFPADAQAPEFSMPAMMSHDVTDQTIVPQMFVSTGQE